MSLELSVLSLLLGAFFAPLFAKVLKMPVAVGELVYGLALGLLLGGGISESQTVAFLSEFGFMLLMFLVGLEIDFDLLEDTPKGTIGLYLGYFGAVMALSLTLVPLLGFRVGIGAVLSLVSVGLVLVSLRESGLMEKEIGKRFLILGVVGEVLSLVVITLLHKLGEFRDLENFFKDLLITVLFFLGLFILFRAVKLLLWWYPELIGFISYGRDTSAVSIRLSLFVMFFLSVLAHASGTESAVGAFLGGAILSYFLRDKEELEHKLSAMGYGFLIPVFFIHTGVKMELSEFSYHTLKLSFGFLILMLAVRYLPAPLLLLARFNPKEVALLPLLLAYPFTLMVAGAEILNRMGVIGTEVHLALIISAVLSTLIFPWIGKPAMRRL